MFYCLQTIISDEIRHFKKIENNRTHHLLKEKMFAVRRTVLKSKNLTRTAGLVNNTANRRWFSTDGANPKVFFDIQIGEQKAGRVVFEVCDSFFSVLFFFE